MKHRSLLILLKIFALMTLAWSIPAQAKVIQHTESFLEELAPRCPRRKTTHYLTAEQKKLIQPTSSSVIVRHEISCGNRVVYFDSHRVRSQSETLAVVIDSQGKVEQVRMLAFDEPEEYLPKQKWFDTFQKKELGPRLALQSDIPMITGATLSARAATEAVRKILRIHQTLNPSQKQAQAQ